MSFLSPISLIIAVCDQVTEAIAWASESLMEANAEGQIISECHDYFVCRSEEQDFHNHLLENGVLRGHLPASRCQYPSFAEQRAAEELSDPNNFHSSLSKALFAYERSRLSMKVYTKGERGKVTVEDVFIAGAEYAMLSLIERQSNALRMENITREVCSKEAPNWPF